MPQCWLRLLLVASRIDGSFLISMFLLSFEFTVGLRRCLVLEPLSLCGLLVVEILLIGLLLLLLGGSGYW